MKRVSCFIQPIIVDQYKKTKPLQCALYSPDFPRHANHTIKLPIFSVRAGRQLSSFWGQKWESKLQRNILLISPLSLLFQGASGSWHYSVTYMQVDQEYIRNLVESRGKSEHRLKTRWQYVLYLDNEKVKWAYSSIVTRKSIINNSVDKDGRG